MSAARPAPAARPARALGCNNAIAPTQPMHIDDLKYLRRQQADRVRLGRPAPRTPAPRWAWTYR
ncbi:predicted protein [Streptomyces viridochromogenes DSM 40736]|uniref:Predicted protein n=1 Tax=Streptomyces viridochromogenes (strain DSM 40736 / JCM 4977 / BCRC 1201 / Tue 494) TaxID=591159 RepID=D9X957_STRVT|nr:predicted protein [Streptomyces viridochromogenes DSM 40736]